MLEMLDRFQHKRKARDHIKERSGTTGYVKAIAGITLNIRVEINTI